VQSHDEDPRTAFLLDWPPAFSGVLAAASLGDPKALWLLQEIYPGALRLDPDQSLTNRMLASLKDQVDDLDSPFVETEGSQPEIDAEAPNAQSADPFDHLVLAAHLPTELNDLARLKECVIQLLISERLFAAAGLPDQAMLVGERRSWAARKLPRAAAIDVVEQAATWRASGGFMSAPLAEAPSEVAVRAKSDLELVDQIEKPVSRGNLLSQLKLRILDMLTRIETDDAMERRLQGELANLLILDRNNFNMDNSQAIFDRLLGSDARLSPEIAVNLAKRKVELFEGDMASIDIKDYRSALIDLNQRLTNLSEVDRKVVARSFKTNPILFADHSWLSGTGINSMTEVSAALEARLALVDTLVTAAPENVELLADRGVTYLSVAIQTTSDLNPHPTIKQKRS
jgi:hypothetical protein